jgi:hypothetical protein
MKPLPGYISVLLAFHLICHYRNYVGSDLYNDKIYQDHRARVEQFKVICVGLEIRFTKASFKSDNIKHNRRQSDVILKRMCCDTPPQSRASGASWSTSLIRSNKNRPVYFTNRGGIGFYISTCKCKMCL